MSAYIHVYIYVHTYRIAYNANHGLQTSTSLYLLRDLALVEDEDLVARHCRRKAMGYEDARPVLQKAAAHGGQNLGLGAKKSVQGAG